MHDDGVSVIIASYRWPEALRISLASALWQTHQHVEVLVIEDGPACATRDVVREFDDPRVQYHALGENSGSQSGPNQFGLSIARYRWVAYLGHDDVWEPRHLATLLATAAHTGATAVHSGCVMMDTLPSQIAVLAGLATWAPERFVPPSSLMHRRSLADDPAIWPEPTTSRQPIDYLALCALQERGAVFASSGEVTLAKIAAAWRFRREESRSVEAHMQLLEACRQTPSPAVSLAAWLELVGMDRLELEYPAARAFDPGWGTDRNRRMRGLRPLGEPCTTFDLRYAHVDPNWHALETFGGRTFRWTGPGPLTTVLLDAPQPFSTSVTLTFDVVGVVAPVTGNLPFTVTVDGTVVAVTAASRRWRLRSRRGIVRYVANVVRSSHAIETPLEITIQTGPPRRPPAHRSVAQDERQLGVAFAAISAQ